MTNKEILTKAIESGVIKHYNLWQRLTFKPEADRQKEKLERLQQKLTECLKRDNAIISDLTLSEIRELLDLLP